MTSRNLAAFALCCSTLCMVAVAGCTDDSGEPDDGLPDVPEAKDVRIPLPAPDERFIDLVTPDIRIEAGSEKMYCLYLSNDQGDLAVRNMDALQGKGGHHIVMLTTIEPKPTGTLEDCSAQEDMWKFRSFILPGQGLPDGHGIRVAPGMQYVMQIHYVNTEETAILVRDVARLEKIDPAQVTRWVTTLTTNALEIEVNPGTGTKTFDCTLPEEVDLLLVGGHMHEQGKRFSLEFGPSTSELQSMYLVDPWRPSYRDAPPVTLFFSQPRRVAAGTVVRTTCEWNNDTTQPIEFPAEMCAGFGYIAGTTTPFHCQPE